MKVIKSDKVIEHFISAPNSQREARQGTIRHGFIFILIIYENHTLRCDLHIKNAITFNFLIAVLNFDSM